jgi:NADH pyrophosphatase NudC (nudix superfamily)
MPLDAHLLSLLALTTGVGFLMTKAGLGKNALEWRRRRRICPSCGRDVQRGPCACA